MLKRHLANNEIPENPRSNSQPLTSHFCTITNHLRNPDPPEHVEDASTPNEEPKQSSTSNGSSSNNNNNNNTTTQDGAPSPNPSKVKPSSSGPGDASRQQNDVRAPSNPAAQSHNEDFQAKHNVDDSTGGLDTGDNPDKLDGPGPKPVAQVAKEHGGDAGNVSKDGSSSSSASSSESDLNKKKNQAGEGMLWVKSSGLQADGGDFDATKPGAGREADRELPCPSSVGLLWVLLLDICIQI